MNAHIPHVELTRVYDVNFHRILGQISDDLWGGVNPAKVKERMLEEIDKLLMAFERWFEVVQQNIQSAAPEQMKL